MQANMRRHHVFEGCHLSTNGINGFNDISVGRATHDQQHRLPSVEKTSVEHFLHGILDRGDILQTHRGPIAPSDDQRPVLSRLHQLPTRTDQPLTLVVFDQAVRLHDVGIGQGTTHIVKGHTGVDQRSRIQADTHGRQRAAAYLNLAHPFDLGYFLRQHGGSKIVQLTLSGSFRGQGQHNNGCR